MKHTYVSDTRAQQLENCFFGSLKNFRSFITSDIAGSEEPGLSPVNISPPANNPSAPVIPFAGTGHRLGGDMPPQSNSYSKFNP